MTDQKEVAPFSAFERDLAEYKSKYERLVYDFTDPKQEKQARSDRHQLGKKIADLDRVHKNIKAPLKVQIDKLDGERKRIKDSLTEVQDGIKKQIQDHELKQQAIEDALTARVKEIADLAEFHPGEPITSSEAKDRLALVAEMKITDSFEHRKADAALAKTEATEKLKGIIERMEKSEAEAAELARLREAEEARQRKEREEQIARDATAAAERKAQEAIDKERQEKEAAQEQARQAEQDAQRRAQEAVEAENRKRVAQEKAEEAERIRQAANRRHRGKINKEALEALSGLSLDEEIGKKIITAIARGRIPHITINY